MGSLRVRDRRTAHMLSRFKHIVEMGRETERLKFGVKYVLLPLNGQNTNWELIRDLSFTILSQGRGPFFVDLEEVEEQESGDRWVEPIGAYLIDSVVLDPPILRLIIDPRMSRIKNPSQAKSPGACEIPVHVTSMSKMRRQLMKALRVL
jgi:hypothetical protein